MAPVTVDLWLTSTEAWLDRQDVLIASLSQSECERRARLRDPTVGLRFALGRGLLRAVLANWLGIDPATIQFEIGATGKPTLASSVDANELHFNVSASQEYLAIALCTTCEVGVDVERHRTVSEGLMRSQSVLSDGERARLAGIPAEERSAVFLRWWVRKEAIAKADGRGIAFGLRQIDAGLETFAPNTSVVHAGGRAFLMADSNRTDGVYCSVAAVASGEQPEAPLIRHVDYARLAG